MEMFILGMVILAILALLSLMIVASDEDFVFKMYSIICVIVLMILISIFAVAISKDFYYEMGQVDAINGNIRYELVKQANGELYWKLKK